MQEVSGLEQASFDVKWTFERGQRPPRVCSFCLLLTFSGFLPGLPRERRLPLSQPCHGGHIVLAQTLFHPLLPGPPTRWADVSLADAGVAELSWNWFRRPWGWHGGEFCGLVSRPKARRAARAQGPQTQAFPSCRWLQRGSSGRGQILCFFVSCRPR